MENDFDWTQQREESFAHSIPLPLYKAKIVDINDPNEKGAIKIRVLPQFKDIKESLLPWAQPLLSTGMNASEYSFTPPQIGSLVWIIFSDRFWKSPYWIPGYFINGFFDYTTVKSLLDSATDVSDSDYPNINFSLLPDGSIIFNNTDNGEIGTIHNSGAYSIFDSSGNVYTYSGSSTQKLYNDNGSIEIASNGQVSINSGVLIVDP